MEIMKPEEQRIAIAKACGFTIESDGITHCLTPCDFSGNYNPEAKLLKKVPDYLNDLNAMHEAEKVLWDTGKAMAFTNQLVGTVCSSQGFRWDKGTPDDHLMYLSHATAAQRAEAFLHTLGKWVEL